MKKYHYFKRDYKGLCCEILFPILFLLLPIYFNKVKKSEWSPSLAIDEHMYPNPQSVLINSLTNSVPSSFIDKLKILDLKTEFFSDQSLLTFEKTILNKRNIKPVRLGSYSI